MEAKPRVEIHPSEEERLRTVFASLHEGLSSLHRVLRETDRRRYVYRHAVFFQRGVSVLRLGTVPREEGRPATASPSTASSIDREKAFITFQYFRKLLKHCSPGECVEPFYLLHCYLRRYAVPASTQELSAARVDTASLQLVLLSLYSRVLVDAAAVVLWVVDRCDRVQWTTAGRPRQPLTRISLLRLWGEAYVKAVEERDGSAGPPSLPERTSVAASQAGKRGRRAASSYGALLLTSDTLNRQESSTKKWRGPQKKRKVEQEKKRP